MCNSGLGYATVKHAAIVALKRSSYKHVTSCTGTVVLVVGVIGLVCASKLTLQFMAHQAKQHNKLSPNEFKKSEIFFMLHVITSTYSLFAQSC